MNFFIQASDILPCLAHFPSISPSMLFFILVFGESRVRFLSLFIVFPLCTHSESVIIFDPIPFSMSFESLKFVTSNFGSSIPSSAFSIITGLFGEGPTLFREIGIIFLAVKQSFMYLLSSIMSLHDSIASFTSDIELVSTTYISAGQYFENSTSAPDFLLKDFVYSGKDLKVSPLEIALNFLNMTFGVDFSSVLATWNIVYALLDPNIRLLFESRLLASRLGTLQKVESQD